MPIFEELFLESPGFLRPLSLVLNYLDFAVHYEDLIPSTKAIEKYINDIKVFFLVYETDGKYIFSFS